MGRYCSVCIAALALLLGSHAEAQGPDAKRFSAEKHVPGPCLVHLSIGNVTRLREKVATTIFGQIAMHPGTRQAFSEFSAWLGELAEEPNAHFRAVTGKSPLELLELLNGEVSFTLRSVTPGLVEAVLALELGRSADEIPRVLAKVQAWAEEAEGKKFGTIAFGGSQATAWPVPWGEAVSGIVGTHLVIATTRDLWNQLTETFSSSKDTAPAASLLPQELVSRIAAPESELLLGVDLGTLRNMSMAISAASPQKQEISRAMRASGFHRVTWLGFSLGVKDGGLLANAHLGMRDGKGDVLDALRGGLLPVKDTASALGQVPASAHEVYAFRLAPGDCLSSIDRILRSTFPDLGEWLDRSYEQLEEHTGIAADKDIFTLGEVEACGFKSTPPAGALLDDDILLLRTEAFAPYRRLLEKLVLAAGARVKHVESTTGKVEYFDFGSGKARSAIHSLILAGSPDLLAPEDLMSTFLAFAGQNFCDAELPGGWTAVSNSTQALVRQLEHYATGPKLPLDGALGALAKLRLAGGGFTSVSLGERSSLAAYNSILQILTLFAPLLSAASVDVAQLPPAELFLSLTKPGFLSITTSPAGFTLRSERGPNLAQATLVTAVGGGVLAGFLVPALMKGRGEAYKVQCANNLKQLHGLSVVHSSEKGKNYFPHSDDGSLASLKLLFDGEDGLQSRLLICPEGDESPATADADGHFELSDESCSYEIVPWRLKNTAPGALLMFDKAPHHHGGRNVLMSDGSISFMLEPEFQELLEQQKARYQKPADGGEKKQRNK